MEIVEIDCGENEIVLIYCNIFIANKIRFLSRIICVLFNKVEKRRDISVDLKSLISDIEDFENRIHSRLENGNAEEKDIAENTTTLCLAIADRFRKKHELLEEINLKQLCG